MKDKDRKKAWDRQWRGNVLSTCIHHMDREAAGVVAAGWEGFFKALPKGARVLDLGTGNGVVALTALMVSDAAGLAFEIHGADLAAIAPERAVPNEAARLGRIAFHGETPSEDLPFEAGYFDAVTGQHALEYGDIEKSAAEIARVVKKDGAIRFLMHAASGEIVQANFCKIEQGRYVLEDARLFEETEKAVADALTGAGDGGRALRAALARTYQAFKDDPVTSDLTQLLELLWGAYEQRGNFPDFNTFKYWIAENRAELEAQMIRIAALKEAALDEQAAARVVASFAKRGIKANLSPVNASGGRLIGWLLAG